MNRAIYALHGNLGTPEDWASVEAAMGQTFTKLDLFQEILPYAAWAEATWPKLAEGSVLLGYSLGARLALHLLKAAPLGHFHAVVLISCHPGLTDAEERAARSIADADWAEKALHLPWDAFLAAWQAQPVFAKTTAREEPLPQLASRRASIAAAFQHWSLGLQEDFRPFLRDYAAENLHWITGIQDPKFSGLAQAVCPPWKHHLLAGGHRLLWDAPDAVARILKLCLTEENQSK